MCGICGIASLKRKIDKQALADVEKMNARIYHRGPDSAGEFSDDHAVLAMRRLSIIDLEGGSQPMWNSSMTVCVFMNGEIYNFLELREDLIADGYTFRTQSDTEVIAHLYDREGSSFVTLLKGMFAFCIYDRNHEELIIGRDRFGEKPLYYHYDNSELSFSSEMSSLLENSKIERTLDLEGLNYYLSSAWIPEPLTLIQGVKVLPPGNLMRLSSSGLDVNPYFIIDYSDAGRITDMGEAVEYMKPYLERAVARQSISDVPLGAFLSGGIDSSSICALLQKSSDNPIDTFTVKFEEASYDESAIAKDVASHIGSNHHELLISNEGFTASTFWEVINHAGAFPDSSTIPVSQISKEISRHVKVAISGDGGDEIFAGYPDLEWWQKIYKTTKIPRSLRSLSRSLLSSSYFPLSSGKKRQISRGLSASLHGREGISMEIYRMFFDVEMQSLMKDGKVANRALFENVPSKFSQWSPLRMAMYHRIKHNLPNDMLVKVDRMSMAHSLEVRAPFLDPDLYDASIKLSDDLLYTKGIGKRILREIMKDDLPASVFNHPKSGFSIPLHKYQNAAFDELVTELVNKSSSIYDLFDEDALKQVMSKSRNTDDAYTTVYRTAHQRWTLLMLFGWVKRFGVGVK